MLYKKTLKYIFIISFAIAVIYPLVNIHLIFPSFRQLLVKNTEDEAVRVAKSLSSMVMSGDNKLKKPAEFSGEIEQAKEDFNLEKLKVFSENGEIIYSADQKDIGAINRRSYFYESLLKAIHSRNQ